MKSNFRKASSLLALALASGMLFAQDAPQPGRLASATGSSFAPVSLPSLESSSLTASKLMQTAEERHDRTVNRVWLGSMLAVAAATSLDAATSWGKHERNSFLASSNGTFGAKGVGIKASFAAGTIVTEVLLRKHKDLKTKFAIGNLGESAIFTTAAIHNSGISAK